MKFAVRALFAIALALVATSGQANGDEWRPFTANPTYEVFGREENGVFRYTLQRKAIKSDSAPNYGLSMPKHDGPTFTSDEFEVRGTDLALGEAIAKAAASTEQDCNGGRCKPKPEPHTPHLVPASVERDMALSAALILAGMLCFLFAFCLALVLIYLVCRWLFRWLTTPSQP